MDIATLEKMLDGPRDNAMLRLTLAQRLLDAERVDDAIEHLRTAASMQKEYSAVWKLLGKCLTQAGQLDHAREAYQKGILSAKAQGDKQSEKEMQVFLQRLDK